MTDDIINEIVSTQVGYGINNNDDEFNGDDIHNNNNNDSDENDNDENDSEGYLYLSNTNYCSKSYKKSTSTNTNNKPSRSNIIHSTNINNEYI